MRVRVSCASDAIAWLVSESSRQATVTFIVDSGGELWIAHRRSEHVACARGGPVLSAGEITFELVDDGIDVSYVTNQSTGFCPESESWPAIAQALDRAGIGHAGDFDLKCEFRRCQCGQCNIVKNGVFECGVCGSELARRWNLAPENGL